MEKKKMIKAAARRVGATLLALVLILAAFTPAREALAEEFSFDGGVFDAEKSVEEVPETEAASQETEAPVFSFDGGKETAEGELPAVTMPAESQTPQESEPAQMENVESVGGVAEILNVADVTIEQGGSGTYSLRNADGYDYKVPSGSGLSVKASENVATVTASASTAAGTYTIEYGEDFYGYFFNTQGSFTVEVTATDSNGDSNGGTGTTTGPIEETQKMSMEKTADEILDDKGNPTGAYNLTLSLSGSIGSQTNKAKVDVVFIVDSSGSMYSSTKYMQNLRPAMVNLVKNLSTTNGDKIDAQYSIAIFGTTASIRQDFTNANSTITSIEGINSDLGGTNYQYGINQGKELLKSKRDGATTVVIFVTDGIPTFNGIQQYPKGTGTNDNGGNNYYGTAYGNPARCYRSDNINAAVSEISGMYCNYFYCIGIGNDFADSSNMTALTNAVRAETTGVYAVQNGTAAAIESVFNTISAEVTSFLCSNVTITDELSNVDGELMVQVKDPTSVKVEVIKDGKTIAGPEASVTLAATESNKQATLSASYDKGVLTLDFPDDYQLEAGYTYKLHAVIEPTDKAYEEYRETGYTDTGDAGTGTHAGKQGFYCNESATVTYTYKGETGTAIYNHPVIQLHPATLVINKQIVGMDAENLSNLTFPVTLTYPGCDPETVHLPLGAFTYDKETETYTFKIQGLNPGTSYSVTESRETVDKYNVATTVNGIAGKEDSGKVNLDETATVSFVNTYTVAVTDLTLDKNVSGNMGDWSKDFTFTVYVDGEVFGTYKLNHNTEVVTIPGVPIGSKVEIVESDNENYTVTATVDGTPVTVTASTVTIDVVGINGHDVVFTNHYSETVETGIVMDSIPYVMMLLISGAAVFFVMLRKRIGYEG